MDQADKAGDANARQLLEAEARNIEKAMEEVVLDGSNVDVDVLMQMPLDLQQVGCLFVCWLMIDSNNDP